MSGKFVFGQKVTIEIPLYNETDPVLWFYLVEVLFKRSYINSSHDKYDLILLSLGSDKTFNLLHEMRDLIFKQASLPSSQPYETLKSAIIKRALEPGLMKLAKQVEIGKLKPTEYLQHIKNMVGHPWNTDLDLKEIFTLNLPSSLCKLVKILGQEDSLENIAAALDIVFESIVQPSQLEQSPNLLSKTKLSEKGEESQAVKDGSGKNPEKKTKKKRRKSRGLRNRYTEPTKPIMPLLDERVYWQMKEKQVNFKSYSRYIGPSFIGPFRIT